MDKGLRGFVLMPILLVMLAVGGVGFYFISSQNRNPGTQPQVITPTPVAEVASESAVPHTHGEWKTYTNRTAGYQVSYPASWSNSRIYKYLDPDNDLVVLSPENTDKKRGIGFLSREVQFSAGFLEKRDSLSEELSQTFEREFGQPTGDLPPAKTGGVLTKIENTKVGGRDAIRFEYRENYDGPVFGNLYHVKGLGEAVFYCLNFFAADQASIDAHSSEISRILESFVLTEMRPVSSGLKSYRNEEIGLAFQLPVNWTTAEELADGKFNKVTVRDSENYARIIFNLGGETSCILRAYQPGSKETIRVGNQTISLNDFCHNGYSIATGKKFKISLTLDYFGVVAAKKVTAIIQSVSDLRLVRQYQRIK